MYKSMEFFFLHNNVTFILVEYRNKQAKCSKGSQQEIILYGYIYRRIQLYHDYTVFNSDQYAIKIINTAVARQVFLQCHLNNESVCQIILMT